MFSIEPCSLPKNALLNEYVRLGAYTDCFRTEITGRVTHARYVGVFYTTLLFKLERIILKLVLLKPSSDNQAVQLAEGEIDSFSAWYVEERRENQLLLSDFKGRTRSWLMVVPADSEASIKTWLYFGSAVVPKNISGSGAVSFGFGFYLLKGFHKLYSVLLLYSTKLRLMHKPL